MCYNQPNKDPNSNSGQQHQGQKSQTGNNGEAAINQHEMIGVVELERHKAKTYLHRMKEA
jgi:hypothetical protein